MRAVIAAGTVALALAACATHEDSALDPSPTPQNPVGEAGVADASDAGDRDGAGDASGARCSESGFCYVPVPSRTPLIAVSASSIDDAWMLPQESGSILRWDGTSMKTVYSYQGSDPSSITFLAIWAQKKDDVWAVARGSDGNFFFVHYASPPGGGAPAFRELRTDIQILQTASAWNVALWAPPTGEHLWITTGLSVLRVHEASNGAVVEDVTPAIGGEDAGQHWWFSVWGFADDDVYVGGGETLSHENPKAAIGHLTAARWSLKNLDEREYILNLRGTPPAAPNRQLWLYVSQPKSSGYYIDTELRPITGGEVGAPIVSHAAGVAPLCGSRYGQAPAEGVGWFSEGALLCRWSGGEIKPVQMAPDAPIVHTVNDVWAGSPDDVWIVGTALGRPNVPQGAFAARRTAASAKDNRR